MAGWYSIVNGQKVDWPSGQSLPVGADIFHIDFVNQFYYALAERLHVHKMRTDGTRQLLEDNDGVIKVDVTDDDLVKVGDDAQSDDWFIRIRERSREIRDFMGGAGGQDVLPFPTISGGVEVQSIFEPLRDHISSIRSLITDQSVGVRAWPFRGGTNVVVGPGDTKSNPDWPIIRRSVISSGIPRGTPYYWIYEHLGFVEIRPGVFEEVINKTTWEEVWEWMLANAVPNPRWGPEEDPGEEPIHGYVMSGSVPRINDYNYLQSWQGYSDGVVVQPKATQRPDRSASISISGLAETRGETGPIITSYDSTTKEVPVGRLGRESDASAIPATLPEGAAGFVLLWPPGGFNRFPLAIQTNATWTFDFHYQ